MNQHEDAHTHTSLVQIAGSFNKMVGKGHVERRVMLRRRWLESASDLTFAQYIANLEAMSYYGKSSKKWGQQEWSQGGWKAPNDSAPAYPKKIPAWKAAPSASPAMPGPVAQPAPVMQPAPGMQPGPMMAAGPTVVPPVINVDQSEPGYYDTMCPMCNHGFTVQLAASELKSEAQHKAEEEARTLANMQATILRLEKESRERKASEKALMDSQAQLMETLARTPAKRKSTAAPKAKAKAKAKAAANP